MVQKLSNKLKVNKQQGGFGIEILFPGKSIGSLDTGIGTIGRIDQAVVLPGTLVPMHPHRDDEILTYLRSGRVKHIDSEGVEDQISSTRLMMMNAGATYYHEELVMDGDVLQGLQIFIRPEKAGLAPMVQFHDLPQAHSLNQWRALAGQGEPFPLRIRSSTWLYDMRLEAGRAQSLPPLPLAAASSLLYVFAGEVLVNGSIAISRGESVFVEEETINILASSTADLVLFATDRKAAYSEEGMYSGNQNIKLQLK